MRSIIQLLGYALGLLVAGRACGATPPVADNVLGHCVGKYFPDAVSDMRFYGSYYVQYYDEQKAYDLLAATTSSHDPQDVFFNSNYVMSRMGGFVHECNSVLDTIMSIGQQNSDYGRLFNAVLGAIPNLDIVIHSRAQLPPNSLNLGTYGRDKKQLTLYPHAGFRLKKISFNMTKTIFAHETIHALMDAYRNTTRVEDWAKNKDTYMRTTQEKFQRYRDFFMDGIRHARKTKEQLMKYTYKREQLSKQEIKGIEKLIVFANQMANQYGRPFIHFTLEKEKSGIMYHHGETYLQDVMKEPEYTIAAKFEHPCQVVDEYQIGDKTWHFVAFKDNLLTYLEILLRIYGALEKSAKYKQGLDQQDPEEYFTFTFSEVPWPMAEKLTSALYNEFLSILEQIEATLPKTASISFGAPSLYHPDYIDSMHILNQVFKPNFLATDNLAKYIRICQIVIHLSDKKRYPLVEVALREMIHLGLVKGQEKADVQLMLVEVLVKQNMLEEAHVVFEQNTKSDVNFDLNQFASYQSILAKNNKNPGDDNPIKSAQEKTSRNKNKQEL